MFPDPQAWLAPQTSVSDLSQQWTWSMQQQQYVDPVYSVAQASNADQEQARLNQERYQRLQAQQPIEQPCPALSELSLRSTTKRYSTEALLVEDYTELEILEKIILRQARHTYGRIYMTKSPDDFEILTFLTKAKYGEDYEHPSVAGTEGTVAVLIVQPEKGQPWRGVTRSNPREGMKAAYEELLETTQRDLKKVIIGDLARQNARAP